MKTLTSLSTWKRLSVHFFYLANNPNILQRFITKTSVRHTATQANVLLYYRKHKCTRSFISLKKWQQCRPLVRPHLLWFLPEEQLVRTGVFLLAFSFFFFFRPFCSLRWFWRAESFVEAGGSFAVFASEYNWNIKDVNVIYPCGADKMVKLRLLFNSHQPHTHIYGVPSL